MRNISVYINEKIAISKSSTRKYNVTPKSTTELTDIINDRIAKYGDEVDLNDIDVYEITDMSKMFHEYGSLKMSPDTFKPDVSSWDVSNVTNMYGMFSGLFEFDCDLSLWDVSKVESMEEMFANCHTFNRSLATWNVKNVKTMHAMFMGCVSFNQDLSMWDMSSVEDISNMFNSCIALQRNMERWKLNDNCRTYDAFAFCKKVQKYPSWY